MNIKHWSGMGLIVGGAFAVVVASNMRSTTAAPGPSPVLVVNAANSPVPVTGAVQIVGGGQGFSSKGSSSDTGAELSFFVDGPVDGGYDAMVIENFSAQVNAPSGQVIMAILQIYPPSGEFDDRSVAYIPLVPQGSFGLRTMYAANQSLRLYSSPESGNHVNVVIQCHGCDASDSTSATVALSGRTID